MTTEPSRTAGKTAALPAFMQPHEERLHHFRSDRKAWREADFLRYTDETDAEGEHLDLSYPVRYGVLLCLQYDLMPEDEALVRYLFKQEVRSLEASPFQGVSEALQLGGWLLARFGRPKNLWLFYRAKVANFDTLCGFDYEHLFAAGARSVRQEVAAAPRRRRKRLHMLLEDYEIPTRKAIREWRVGKAACFPTDSELESRLEWISRALEFGDPDSARDLLDAWERTPDEEALPGNRTLMNLRRQMKQPEKALLSARRLVDEAKSPWDETSALMSVVQVAAEAGHYPEAWDALRRIDLLFQENLDWKSYGLSLAAVEAALDLADKTPKEDPHCDQAFRLAHGFLGCGFRASLNVMEKATEIAKKLGDRVLEAKYRKRTRAEQKRIEKG